jgi:hypothetical protein
MIIERPIMRDYPAFALAAWYGVANDLGCGGGRA